ncbi:Replication-associated recombination protein A [[Mycoplasma] cavipharyngis]|uniref:AAA family ATPase n=1 Tax=[Mycoplasma] cavipharyngis TaxID=92757 RepID=UPI00370406A0
MNKTNLIELLQPKKLSDIIGQTHLIGSDKLITKMVQLEKIFSLIFFGPPGTGKSSLTKVICNELNINPIIFQSSLETKKQLLDKIQLLQLQPINQRVLIVEEIHLLHVDKQDLFLSALEKQEFILFATTTENPFFVINPAIRSRAQLIELQAISDDEILIFINKLIAEKHCLTNLTTNQKNVLSRHVNGDIRFLLNTISKLNLLYPETINDENLQIILGLSHCITSDDNNEYHNLKSALQKSIRGSDPNAAIYYLAKLLEIGDLKTIARRLIVCAFEDIGLANMNLCNRVINAVNNAIKIGMPECINLLGPIVIDMALSVKSNSGSKALSEALLFIRSNPNFLIPKHLHDNHYQSAIKLGVKGYLYPHDYPYHYIEQQYLPTKIKNHIFYHYDLYSPYEIKTLNYWKNVKNAIQNLKLKS